MADDADTLIPNAKPRAKPAMVAATSRVKTRGDSQKPVRHTASTVSPTSISRSIRLRSEPV